MSDSQTKSTEMKALTVVPGVDIKLQSDLAALAADMGNNIRMTFAHDEGDIGFIREDIAEAQMRAVAEAMRDEAISECNILANFMRSRPDNLALISLAKEAAKSIGEINIDDVIASVTAKGNK